MNGGLKSTMIFRLLSFACPAILKVFSVSVRHLYAHRRSIGESSSKLTDYNV